MEPSATKRVILVTDAQHPLLTSNPTIADIHILKTTPSLLPIQPIRAPNLTPL